MSASSTLISLGTIVALYALLSLALNVKFGFTGILDFGHVAYFLIGAYTAALLVVVPSGEQRYTEYILGLELPTQAINAVESVTGVHLEVIGGLGWLIAIVAAVLVAAFLGLIVALPAIRLREDYLAITLLGVGVIAQRVFRTEEWLANGPDSLAGYALPFEGLFPLTDTTISGSVVVALVLFTVWSIVLVLAAREQIFDRRDTFGANLAHIGLAAASLLVGYLAVRRARQRKQTANLPDVGPQVALRHYLDVAGAAVLLGIAGGIVGYYGSMAVVLFVLLGLASLASWVVAGVKVRRHYAAYGRREAAAGVVFTVGLVVAIAPVFFLGDTEGTLAWIASVATFVLLGGFFAGLYFANERWDEFGLNGSFLGIIGIGLLWVLAFRYFVVPLEGSFTDPAGLGFVTMENLLWLVEIQEIFDGNLNYRRFMFILFIAMVFIVYFLVEIIVKSPYGRVLRAVRDDENVAQSLGKNAFSYKVQSMVIGCGIAGLAGALGAMYYGSLTFTHFQPLITFWVFMAVILGGKANNKGVILGAAFFWLLERSTVELGGFFPGAIGNRLIILQNAMVGIILILVLYYRPEGIWKERQFVTEVESG